VAKKLLCYEIGMQSGAVLSALIFKQSLKQHAV
jgi:hypothetical protein